MKKKLFAIISLFAAALCSLLLFACTERSDDPDGSTHTHNYVWVDNGDGTHCRHCSVEGCDAPDINVGNHDFSNGNCVCGKVHTHAFDRQTVEQKYIMSAATCTKKAKYYYSCECGEKGTETFEHGEIDPNAHTEVKDNAVAPTCTETGLTEGKHCSECNAVLLAQTEVDALGHDFAREFTTDTEPTCTAVGSKSKHCSRCDEKSEVTEIDIDDNAHSFDEGEITTAPTCTTEGVKTYTCTRDSSHTKTESVAKLAHTPAAAIRENEVATTCSAQGSYDEVVNCSVCGTEISRTAKTIEIDADAHSWNAGEITTNATCTTDGVKTYTCTHNSAHTKTESVAAFGHDFATEFTVDVEPSCTEVGSKSKHCSRCEEKSEVTEIAALGHSYGEWETTLAATCSAQGSKKRTCSVCSHEETAAIEIDADAHSWNAGEITTNATCTTEGVKTYTCTRDNSHTKTEPVNALGHDFATEFTVDKDPTCTEVGSKSKHCSRCDETSEVTEVAANGHNYGEWETTLAATCSAQGSKKRTCSVCSHEEIATIEIDANAHSYNEGVITTYATCTTAGVKTYTCTHNSAHTKTEPVNAFGHDYTDYICERCGVIDPSAPDTEGLTYSKNGDDTYTVTGIGSATGKYLKIPSQYNGKAVTSIGNMAFFWNASLTSVIIPDSVKSIANQAFYFCKGLIRVTIGNSVESIEAKAFSGCAKLTSVTIPNSVTSIGTSAFSECYTLVEVYNLSSLTIAKGSSDNGNVGYYALNVCNSSSIPSKISTTQDGYVFYEDGDTVYLVGYTGTETSLTLPDKYNNKNYAIYTSAFRDNYGLASVTIPNCVTSIGVAAFWSCYGLTSITISNSVASIGNNAFYACDKLVEVYNLSSLTITKGSTDNGKVGYSALNVYTSTTEPSKLSAAQDGYVFYEDGDTVYLIGYTGTQTSLTLPDKYNNKNYAIYQYAFRSCTKLTSISIPNSITSIGGDAFNSCTGLTSITIPNSVTSIEDWTFYNCSGLTSITIPNSVTSIGDSAFKDCRGLTSITIGSGVTSIGDSAFRNCSGLTSITIPNSVTSIGDSAFRNCSKLTNVYYKSTSTEWSTIGIGPYNDKLTSATIYYYSEMPPSEAGNYWRYVDGVPTAW